MAHVYILKSNKGKYYIGSTINIKRRLLHHKQGHTPSTKKLGNIELVFSQKYETLEQARIVEKKMKKLKRKDYIEKIIKEGVIKMRV